MFVCAVRAKHIAADLVVAAIVDAWRVQKRKDVAYFWSEFMSLVLLVSEIFALTLSLHPLRFDGGGGDKDLRSR